MKRRQLGEWLIVVFIIQVAGFYGDEEPEPERTTL